MKKKLTNNIGMKILSVVIAFIVWIIIVNIEDPMTSRTFHVAVDILNENAVESEGKVYRVIEGSEVDVTVKGNKSFVDSLKVSDIKATADLSHLSFTNSTSIEPDCTKYTNSKYELVLGKVKNLVVEVEEIAEERYPVRFNIVGKVPDGYYVSANLMKSSPGMITVRDGESVINKIVQVAVDVNVNKRTGDFDVTLEPKAYNSEDEVIESPNLSFNVDKVNVSVQVLPTKTVPININVKGTPAHGYELLESVYEPNQIQIAGPAEVLEKYDKIDITIDVAGATETVDTVVELNQDILPEDIIVADKNTTVAVEVKIQQLQSKEFTITNSDIAVKLPTTITTYSFVDPDKTYTVSVLAPSDKIEEITVDTLKPTIDLSGKTYGSYNVKLQFNSEYDVSIIGDNKVDITLSDPNEVTETTKPEESSNPTKQPAESTAPTVTTEPSSKPEEEDTVGGVENSDTPQEN